MAIITAAKTVYYKILLKLFQINLGKNTVTHLMKNIRIGVFFIFIFIF